MVLSRWWFHGSCAHRHIQSPIGCEMWFNVIGNTRSPIYIGFLKILFFRDYNREVSPSIYVHGTTVPLVFGTLPWLHLVHQLLFILAIRTVSIRQIGTYLSVV